MTVRECSDSDRAAAATRLAVVVGGSRGIGRACAEALRAQGAEVAVTSLTTRVEDFCSVECDVRSLTSVEEAFDQLENLLGVPDIVVVAAGGLQFGPLIKLSDAHLRAMLELNLLGSIRIARRAARGMLRQRWGRVVLLGSVAPNLGTAWATAYSASKAGLVGAARSMASELGPANITVNVVAPGLIDTDLTKGREMWTHAVESSPLRRRGTPAEVAAVVAFLASPDAGYVTGAVIPVDGGMSMGLG